MRRFLGILDSRGRKLWRLQRKRIGGRRHDAYIRNQEEHIDQNFEESTSLPEKERDLL